MYESIKDILLDLFRAPKQPPESPAGSPGSERIFRASPQFLRYQILFLTIFSIVLAIVFFIVSIFVIIDEPLIGLLTSLFLALFWGVGFVSFCFIIHLEYDMRYYVVTDRSLRVRKGVWSIVEQTLTFANIQNITIEQGPIERVFGISRLVVETAGGGGAVDPNQGSMMKNYHRAVMSGLDNADSLRELISTYLRRLPHSSGLGITGEIHRSFSHTAVNGFSQKEITVLQEILAEAKALRATLRACS